MRSALFLVLLVGCGGGDADPLTPDSTPQPPDGALPDLPAPREIKMSTVPMAAGELKEAEMKGGTADRAVIKLTAPTATLDWDIHAHPAGTTIRVVSQSDVMTVEYDFVPTETADWYLLLRNGGSAPMDVQVVIDLYGAMTFDFL